MARLAHARACHGNVATGKSENLILARFEQEVHKRESELIRNRPGESRRKCLPCSENVRTDHQGLCLHSNHRHKDLLSARAPIRVRRKSIIKKRDARHPPHCAITRILAPIDR